MNVILRIYELKFAQKKDISYKVIFGIRSNNFKLEKYYNVYVYHKEAEYEILTSFIEDKQIRRKIEEAVLETTNYEIPSLMKAFLEIMKNYPVVSDIKNLLYNCYSRRIILDDDKFQEIVLELDYNLMIKNMGTLRGVSATNEMIENNISKWKNILPKDIFRIMSFGNKNNYYLWLKGNVEHNATKYIAFLRDVNDLKFDSHHVDRVRFYTLPIKEKMISMSGTNFLNPKFTYFDYILNADEKLEWNADKNRKYLVVVKKDYSTRKKIDKALKKLKKKLTKKSCFIEKNKCYEDYNTEVYIVK